jgi:hypothetical protein
MSQTFSYAEPLTVDRPEDCFFYHKVHIPGVGDVGEQWDLRASIDDYLGRFDFRGKRVLDVGAAAGFLFGMILSHLRDPFQALYSASRLARDTIIVTNQMMPDTRPVAGFIPSSQNKERMAWWSLSRGCLTQMLDILGFAVKSSTESKPLCLVKGRERPEPCTSLVARRIAGTTCLTGSARAPKLAA